MSYELLRSRRRFMLGAVGAAMGGLAIGGTQANPFYGDSGMALPKQFADSATASAFWALPRVVNILRVKTGEHAQVCYWRDNALQADGYRQVCHLLRDVRAGEVTAMDLRLLNLLCAMQAWLYSAYGYLQPYNATSGYRTRGTNALTEGAAKDSAHVKGMAIDGRFPGLPVPYVGQLAKMFQTGGVGFYMDARNFIHTDVGRVRSWSVR